MKMLRTTFIFSCLILTIRNEIQNFLIKKENYHETVTCIENIVEMYTEKDLLLIVNMKFYYAPKNMFENSTIIVANNILTNKKLHFNLFVILAENFTEFSTSLTLLSKSSYWNPRAKFLIGTSKTQAIDVFFIKSLKLSVLNINIIKGENIYTYFPYKNGSCGQNTNYDLLSVCTNIQLNSHELFPPKVPLDLNGCNVRIMGYPMIPYVIDVNANREVPSLAGVEVTMINFLSKKMNFTEVYIPCPHKFWGFKDSSGNYTMMFGSLYNNETDIIIGMTFGNASHVIDFDGSVIYLIDFPVWWVPTALPVANWKNLTAIFESYVWFAIFFIIILNGFIWWFLGKNKEATKEFRELTLCLMHSLYTLLQGSINPPFNNKLRTVFIFWLLTCVLLFTAHQSSLVSILTTPLYDHQISTLEEVVKSDLSFGFFQGAAEAFIEKNNWVFEEIIKRYIPCPLSIYCLNRTAFDRDFAHMRNKRNVEYFIPRYYTLPNGRLMIFQLNITGPGIWVRMHTTKGFHLLEHLDRYLMILQSNGLLAKWDKDKSYTAMKVEGESKHMPLSMSHLQGAFYMHIFGMAISCFVFIFELIYSKYQKRKMLEENKNKTEEYKITKFQFNLQNIQVRN